MSICPICGDKFESEHGVKVHAGRSHDRSLAGETVECETCGAETTRQPYEVREYENHFCSDSCEKEWREKAFIGEQNPNCDGRVTLNCEQCGEEFEVAPYKEDSARFCSLDCKAEFESEYRSGSDSPAWEGGLATITCDYCGDDYDVFPARKEESRFCSYECKGKSREESMRGENNPSWSGGKETLACEYCGEEYEVAPAKAEKSRFCSQKCMIAWRTEEYSGEDHPRWEDNDDYYRGPNWRQQREKARLRDNHECRNCGDEEQLQVHHIIPFESFDDYEEANQLQNLITLCTSCHHKLEWGSITVQSGLDIFAE